MAQIPLFPLHTVLFPGMPISLHIFEERYRQMVARCLEEGGPFGVALLRSGSEVSPDDPWTQRMRAAVGGESAPVPDAVPYAVGTTARIGDSVKLDDGRYYLVANGQRRFRIQGIVQRVPYAVASISFLEETDEPELDAAAAVLRELYSRYWGALANATGQPQEPEALPDGPAQLTYTLAHRLKVSNPRKQRWLEAGSLTRAREIAAVLRAEIALLPAAGPARQSGGAWSWN
jgi:uncharacterized protein